MNDSTNGPNLQYGMVPRMWSSMIVKNCLRTLIQIRSYSLWPHFSVPAAAGSQASLESRNEVSTPEIRQQMTAPPHVPNHSRRPRHSTTFHSQGGPTHCHRVPKVRGERCLWWAALCCPSTRQQFQVDEQTQVPKILVKVLFLSGPIKSGFTWYAQLIKTSWHWSVFQLGSCDYHSDTK